jgi:carbon monoxide dehydrogenase subunit G
MPEVEYSAEIAAPVLAVWDFVKEMDNWAPLLTGYQKHEKINAEESLWFVKGELAGMTRIAEFRVLITEWVAPQRVAFSLQGLQEPVNGTGEFVASEIGEAYPAPQGAGRLGRFRNRIARWVLNRIFRRRPGASQEPRVGTKLSRITFALKLQAGGALGPVMNIMLAPMLKPVVQDLADHIAKEVEARSRN